jgi:hypothetical protein
VASLKEVALTKARHQRWCRDGDPGTSPPDCVLQTRRNALMQLGPGRLCFVAIYLILLIDMQLPKLQSVETDGPWIDQNTATASRRNPAVITSSPLRLRRRTVAGCCRRRQAVHSMSRSVDRQNATTPTTRAS